METHLEHKQKREHANHNRAYWGVFGALAVFTVIELGMPSVLSSTRLVMILALMTVATMKAGLVGAFYMHLKFEKRLLVWIAVAPLLLVFILIQLIGHDVSAVNHGGWTITHAEKPAQGEHQ